MLNKNVCPNCGQLYDTELSKCPLCGTAPQVVDTADPVQRKRITEAERKQRRADRKEAEQEARRRRRDAQFMQDADEERLIEEEEARRKEEKRRMKEEKKAARRAGQLPEDEAPDRDGASEAVPAFTPAPARDGRGPMAEESSVRDRRCVPRVFLILSTVILSAALLVGGSYLLWKTGAVKLPFYDELAAKKDARPAEPVPADTADSQAQTQAPASRPGDGSEIPCSALTLGRESIAFTSVGEQVQLIANPAPADTTDELRFVSSDEAVAKVSPVGIVTAIGPGSAVITVSCGDQSASCAVSCEDASGGETAASTLEVEALTLNKDDMTFFAAGENYVLSVTNVPAGTPVTWESLDESVCTVDAGGHVVAVGEGTTRVFAHVGNLDTFCWVRCRFG